MNQYEQKAIEALESMGASMTLERLGNTYPTWDEGNRHPLYRFTIKTTRGTYGGDFYGSMAELAAEIRAARVKYPTHSSKEAKQAKKELEDNRTTVYDVLSCLTKSNPGTFNDFCAEFGYSNDSINALNTYRAALKEYEGMARIFTAEQLEKLQEIQ